jgi:RimJ/RimL family protein N-acetyltransferase
MAKDKDTSMNAIPDISMVYSLLEQDSFKNLVTLKMLNSYSQYMKLQLNQNGKDWALLSILPVAASDWDKHTYPNATNVVLLNGNCDNLMAGLLHLVPEGPLVVKTCDKKVIDYFISEMNATKLTSFHSFTRNPAQSTFSQSDEVQKKDFINEEAWELFGKNGYSPNELERSLKNGAQWFCICMEKKIASICLVYQNYKDIWEIGGVYTQPDYRKKGFGKGVVLAALDYIEQRKWIPRYQVKTDNHHSIQLAKSCGLIEFLRIDHLAVGFV